MRQEMARKWPKADTETSLLLPVSGGIKFLQDWVSDKEIRGEVDRRPHPERAGAGVGAA